MEHLFDLVAVSGIIAVATIYLWRTFSKTRKGCGSICAGCSGSQTKVKEFTTQQPVKFQPRSDSRY